MTTSAADRATPPSGRRAAKGDVTSTGLPAVGSVARLPKRISPSRMSDFMQCPRLFMYKTILFLSDPSTIYTARGTLAHTAFERIFDHPPGQRVVADAVAYVRPAWRVMLHPLAERHEVEPDSPEARIRDDHTPPAWRDAVKPGSKDEKRMLESAADYAGLCARHAEGSEQTAAEVEEALLSTAEEMVRSWFSMENPNAFTPEARELHVQARTLGVTMHGYIDRLDKMTGRDGNEYVFISDYKAVALDTPLPTPVGWTTMGEVQVGDELLGADGRPTMVLGKSRVFEGRPCFEVQFDDDSGVVVDGEHLWRVSYEVPNRTRSWIRTEVVTTERLIEMRQEGKYPIWIDNAAPLELPEAELPVDPWVLGNWLAHHGKPSPDRSVPTHEALVDRLGDPGVLDRKHVPAVYFRSSVPQRLALLQGLMDTAGFWDPLRNQAVFRAVAPDLADAVQELVHSLGGRTFRSDKPDENEVRGHSVASQVTFTPVGYNPFRREGAAELVPTDVPSTTNRRFIAAIAPVVSVPTQCVKVAAADSLFLVGRQMVPTHNTGRVPGDGKNYRLETMRRIEDEAFFAMKVYALLYWELHKVVPYELRLVYVKTGDPQNGIKRLRVTPAMLNETRKEIGRQWRAIQHAARTEEWKTKTGPLCNYCTFQKFCPAFGGGDELLPQMKALRGEAVVPEDANLFTLTPVTADQSPATDTRAEPDDAPGQGDRSTETAA